MTTARVPARVKDLETCYFWYWGCEPGEHLMPLARGDQMLVVTCPESCPRLVERFTRDGGIVLLYVSVYKAPFIDDVPDDLRRWEGGSPHRSSLLENPYWRGLDLAGHPDWMLRDGDGEPRRPFEAPFYMNGWQQTTALSESYRDAVCHSITEVVRDGRFSGVFVDNVHVNELPSTIEIDGQLRPADMDAHGRAFYELIAAMARTGREASDDYFWVQTNGTGHETIQRVADVMLFESFMYSWAWPRPLMTNEEAVACLNSLPALHERGGRSIALSYFGFSGSDIAEDARRVRRICDEAGAIFADFFSLADTETIAAGARRYVGLQKPGEAAHYPDAAEALANLRPGDPDAAREVYRL